MYHNWFDFEWDKKINCIYTIYKYSVGQQLCCQNNVSLWETYADEEALNESVWRLVLNYNEILTLTLLKQN
jgi:hypothetical protein